MIPVEICRLGRRGDGESGKGAFELISGHRDSVAAAPGGKEGDEVVGEEAVVFATKR